MSQPLQLIQTKNMFIKKSPRGKEKHKKPENAKKPTRKKLKKMHEITAKMKDFLG